MKSIAYYFIIPILFILSSCGKDNHGKGGDNPGGGKDTVPYYVFSDIKDIFGFYGQNRYSYCPSIVKEGDGTVHMFFCGNPNQGIMVDNIYHLRINPDGTKTQAKSVIQPGPSGSWDDHHTCDPSVIAGQFNMGGVDYSYALFFLTNKYGVYYNEIAVAFSNRLDADEWVKYPQLIVTKTWDGEGDQQVGGGKSWGVGQPSAVSLDNKGKVLLTYTIGDISGTRIVWAQLDMSQMDTFSPASATTMVRTGLKNLNNSGTDYTCNSDFAICPEEDIIVMVRPVQPHPSSYPSYINAQLEVDYIKFSNFLISSGEWTPIVRITPTETGFPRNHNAGIERDVFGRISSWKETVIYYTVSKATPDVDASTGRHAEWTYHIYKGFISDQSTKK